ncbi:MAG: T9SS type A sorting domain-containing protein [Bacteroidia bacterium]|nr:T9SS type A sorting domain-containing protein [Bacteroidia bacterium]
MKKIIFSCCCVLGLGSTTLFAQQGSPAAGGNASGSGGTASFSIGQVFYSSPSGTTHKLIQGIQQPIEIQVINAVEETPKWINLVAAVFPNPTTNNFTLKIENKKLDNFSYEFYDSQGKLLATKKIETEETTIESSHLATAYYILKVNDGNKTIKTFKITKFN